MSENILAKLYVTTMPDGSEWAVPVQFIALNRARHYIDEFDGSLDRSLAEDTIPLFEADDFEIADWAQNNMNWSDVCDCAKCIKPASVDFEDGWVNGDHFIK